MENNRYNNTKIYKLYEVTNGYFYIGSTCSTLSKMLSEHKHVAIRQPETKVYKCFNSIGWNNVKIILMEEHYLENRDQQLREENRVIMMYLHEDKCLNSIRPWFTEEEKLEMSKARQQRTAIHQKEYYKLNRDRILERNKEWSNKIKEVNCYCGCGSVYRMYNKTQHAKSNKHKAWLADQQQTSETI